MNWFDKNKFFEKLIIFTWVVFLFFCLFLLTFTSHAAVSNENTSLPYLVDSDNFVNADGYTFEDLVNFYNARWGNAYPKDFTVDDIIIYEYDEVISNVSYHFTSLWIPNSTNYTYEINLNESYNAFDTDINTATITFRGYSSISFSTYRNRYNDPAFTLSASATNVTFFYNSNNTVTYLSSNYNYLQDSDYPVLAIKKVIPIIVPGIPIPPDFTDPDLYPDTNYPAIPTWDNIGNPPSFDSSDPTGSIFSIIEWGMKDPNGPYHVITNNLSKGFKYLADSFKAIGDSIIKNIQNAMQNLYENFESLIEPIGQLIGNISDKVNYLTEPVEVSVIWDNISSTSLVSNYESINTAAESLKGSFNNLSEPSEYKIPIHLENLPSDYFGVLSVQYIDLSVINPVKSLLRTFLWAMMTYSLAITIFDSIANYINGGGDES